MLFTLCCEEEAMPLPYLGFHAVFTLPVLLLLWYLTPTYDATRRRRGALGLAILVAIAFTYTTPWGSYMITTGVWRYGEGVVTARLLSIPAGEYLFFGIQSLTVGFYLYWRGFDPSYEQGDFARVPRIAGVVAGAALFGGGLWMALQRSSWLYLGGLLAWVGPVVALQWAVGGGYLVRRPRAWIEASLVPTILGHRPGAVDSLRAVYDRDRPVRPADRGDAVFPLGGRDDRHRARALRVGPRLERSTDRRKRVVAVRATCQPAASAPFEILLQLSGGQRTTTNGRHDPL